jgi:hypothetical protein
MSTNNAGVNDVINVAQLILGVGLEAYGAKSVGQMLDEKKFIKIRKKADDVEGVFYAQKRLKKARLAAGLSFLGAGAALTDIYIKISTPRYEGNKRFLILPSWSVLNYHLGHNSENKMKGIAERVNQCQEINVSSEEIQEVRQELKASLSRLDKIEEVMKTTLSASQLATTKGSLFYGSRKTNKRELIWNYKLVKDELLGRGELDRFLEIEGTTFLPKTGTIVRNFNQGPNKGMVVKVDLSSRIGRALLRAASLKALLRGMEDYRIHMADCRLKFEKINKNLSRTTSEEIKSLERSTAKVEKSVVEIKEASRK